MGRSAIALILSCLLPGGAALATDRQGEPQPGHAYRVTGVAAHDVLNVRAQPGVSAPNVGRLPHDTRGIVVTGMGQVVSTAAWWRIVSAALPEGGGWVNARFLALENPDAEPATDFPLACGGTEPFWSLEIGDGQARFSAPEGEAPPWRASGWREAAGLRPGYRFAIRLDSASPAAVAGWAAVSRATTFCSDGMSDFEYPYDVLLIAPAGDVLAGCCSRAR